MNCLDCAHAFARSKDGLVGPCPARDFTGKTMLCPASRRMSWLPRSYLKLLGVRLTKTQAAEWAADVRSLSAHQQLEDVMGTNIAKQQERFGTLLDTIDEAAAEYAVALANDASKGMRLTLAKSTAIATIEEALTDELLRRSVLPLMGKKFGFRTDRDLEGKPYPLTTIRSCVCEVLLAGGRIDGNEFNVISGQAYFTKEFWKRKVEELEDVSNVEIKIGEVEIKQRKGFSRDGQDAYVEVIARWRVKRTPQEWKKTIERSDGREFDNRVVVPMNNRMGRDAIIGKAEARTYKAIYTLSGGAYLDATADGEEPPEDAIDVESQEIVPPVVEEDPQDVADEQSRLAEEYVNLLGAATDTDRIDVLIKSAEEDQALLPETLEHVKEAGRQRWRQIKMEAA
jgi:hypothetical protein